MYEIISVNPRKDPALVSRKRGWPNRRLPLAQMVLFLEKYGVFYVWYSYGGVSALL